MKKLKKRFLKTPIKPLVKKNLKSFLNFKFRYKLLKSKLYKIKGRLKKRFLFIYHNKKIKLSLESFQKQPVKDPIISILDTNNSEFVELFKPLKLEVNLKLNSENPISLNQKLGRQYFKTKIFRIFRKNLFDLKKKIWILNHKKIKKKPKPLSKKYLRYIKKNLKKNRKKTGKKKKKKIQEENQLKNKNKQKKKKKISFLVTCNLYNRFLFFIFKVGKKSIWEKNFVSLFDLLSIKLQYSKTVLLLKIFTRLFTRVETTKVKSRKRINYVPVFIKLPRSIFLSLKWIFLAAVKKKGNTSFVDKLFIELVQLLTQRSTFALQKLQENNLAAFRNRSNVHYRWQKTR